MKRLKVGLLGLTGTGADYLFALQSNERFELVAVADRNIEVLRRYGDSPRWRCYEDFRSVIVEAPRTGIDVLFIALEPFQSLEFTDLAAQRGIGVFHKVPWARNFREGQAVASRFNEVECLFVVPRPWQCGPNLSMLKSLQSQLGHMHLAHVEVRTDRPPTGWRGDSVRSGGGVLLNEAYSHVDLLVDLFGIPDLVYARCGAAAGPGSVRNYDTEDTAVVTLSFGGERIGTLSVWRTAGEPQWRLTLVGREGTAILSEQELCVELSEGARHSQPVNWSIDCIVDAFGMSQLDGGGSVATVAEHLPTMAVIEAAYLSQKTGAPESPAQFLGSTIQGQ